MAVQRLVLAVAWLLMSTLLASGSPVGDCPPVDPLDHTDHLPDDKNCSLFYKCDHASPVLFSCPDGLHFNRLLEVCDWPNAAGCTGNSGSSPTAAPTASPNTGSTPAPSTTDKPPNDAPSITTSRPAKQCPAIGTCPKYEDEKSIAKHLPHATNCSQFCKCDHGKPVTFDCPAGLHFNVILEVCDWPQNAGCSRKPTTDAPSTTAKPTTAVPITTAELTTAAPTTSLTTTTAASITTVKATTVVQTTMSERTTAALSETTKDTTAAPSTTSEPTTATPNSTAKPTTSDPVSSTASPSSPATSNPSGECPAVGVCPQYEDDKSIAKHLPHATNCSQFCKCDHGKPITFDCPAGLHFNAFLEVCDWPQSAGCSGRPTTTVPRTTAKSTSAVPSTTAVPTTSPKPTTAVPSTTSVPTTSALTTSAKTTTAATSKTSKPTTVALSTTAEPTTAGPSTTAKPTTAAPVSSSTAAPSSPSTSNPSGECPAAGVCPQYEDEKSIAKHLPHTINCSQFCKCDHGKPVTFDCPAGLHFNALLEVCDWPQNAGCSAGPTTTAPSNTVKPTTAVPSTIETPTTPAKPTTAAPSTNSVPTTSAPSTSAKPTTAVPITTSKPTTVALSTTANPTTAAPVSSTTAVPRSPSTSNPSGECPAVGVCPQYEDEKSIAKHLPHATNCSQFCKCDHGTPVTFDCPAGLHFSAILEVCDWPQSAGCSGKPTTVAPSTPAKPTTIVPGATADPTTAAPTTSAKPTTAAPSTTVKPTTVAPNTTVKPTSAAPSSTASPNVEPCEAVGSCPVYDQQSIVKHLPHRTNCGLYCRCNHGVPFTEKCPIGLHFNAILEVCDWPYNAGCQ